MGKLTHVRQNRLELRKDGEETYNNDGYENIGCIVSGTLVDAHCELNYMGENDENFNITYFEKPCGGNKTPHVYLA